MQYRVERIQGHAGFESVREIAGNADNSEHDPAEAESAEAAIREAATVPDGWVFTEKNGIGTFSNPDVSENYSDCYLAEAMTDKTGQCERCRAWFAEDICTYDAETASYLCPGCAGKATARPWSVNHIGEGVYRREALFDDNHGQIAEMIDAGNGAANAALIVKAVNSFDELVEDLDYIDSAAGLTPAELGKLDEGEIIDIKITAGALVDIIKHAAKAKP